MSASDLNGLIEAAQEIAAKQARLMLKMKEAFERGEDAEATELARELVGLYDGQPKKGDPCDTPLN